MAVTIVFSGEYARGSREKMAQELERLRRETDLVFDFTDVRTMDAACFAEFVTFHEARAAAGLDCELLVLPRRSPIRKLLRDTGAVRLFHVVDSLDETLNGEKPVVFEYAFTGEYYSGIERRTIPRDAAADRSS